VPKTRPNFDTITPDGKVALVYKSGPASRFSKYDFELASVIPAICAINAFCPPDFLLAAYSAIGLPSIYSLF